MRWEEIYKNEREVLGEKMEMHVLVYKSSGGSGSSLYKYITPLQYKDVILLQPLTREHTTTFIQWGQILLLGTEPRSL